VIWLSEHLQDASGPGSPRGQPRGVVVASGCHTQVEHESLESTWSLASARYRLRFCISGKLAGHSPPVAPLAKPTHLC